MFKYIFLNPVSGLTPRSIAGLSNLSINPKLRSYKLWSRWSFFFCPPRFTSGGPDVDLVCEQQPGVEFGFGYV
jgi:hypothetical protein